MSLFGARDLLQRVLRTEGSSRRLAALLSFIPEDRTTRRMVVAALLIGFLYLLLIPNMLYHKSVERDLIAAKTKNSGFIQLSREYSAVRKQVDAIELKGSLSRTAGVIQVMDEITSSLGIKPKLKSIKSLGSREIKGNLGEEGAELVFEKLTVNEMVNLLHRIDSAPLMLTTRTTTMKRSFENPQAVDLTLAVALFTKKPSP